MITTKKRVSDVDFVKACANEKSCKDVASALGLTESAVRVRAAKLRSSGVELPKFPRAVRKPKQVDVTGLNEIVKSVS